MDGICPYCGSSTFENAWGPGNARCSDCKMYFRLAFVRGRFQAVKVESQSDPWGLGRGDAEKLIDPRAPGL